MSQDNFIEDLHDAWLWTTYEDTVAKAIWLLLVSKQFKLHFSKMLSVVEEMFSEKA